jgi:2-oxoglutarate ferredoxin oxidoreductase subunit beta
MALVYGATYVARGFTGRPRQLADLIVGGIRHRGFALIHALSGCVTYNDSWRRLYSQVEDLPADYDSSDLPMALALSMKVEERVPLGLLYRSLKPAYKEVSGSVSVPVSEILARYTL